VPGSEATGGQLLRLSLEMQNNAAEIKLRAERRCGELLGDMAERGERATDGKPSHDVMVSPPTLADLHIEPMQSSRWQKIAAIPLIAQSGGLS
jgi:hypothetical protein